MGNASIQVPRERSARYLYLSAALFAAAGCNSGSTGASTDAGGLGGNPTGGASQPNCEPPSGERPSLRLVSVVTGLDNPLLVVAAPGDTSRLFIVQQNGVIRLARDGALLPDPFLDISANVQASGERGLLGLAFHPDYAQNRRFFVHYSANAAAMAGAAGTAVISELTAAAGNPDQADPDSERRLITQVDPESNHNGGMLEFGPDDGLLYAGFGDGGGGGDEHGTIGNGQDLGTFFGKLLRIDVDARDAGEYGIPAGNMSGNNMSGNGALPEIWSYGWRNPWRFSFDRCTSDLYVGDVGQGRLEEIDFEPADAASGRNYGWRSMEGDSCFNPADDCNPGNELILPVATYPRNVGRSVTGGYVYRGSAIPALRGTYFYADYASARFFTLRIEGGVAVEPREITSELNPDIGVGGISSFGTDNAGELYVTSYATDTVYRLAAQ